MPFPFSFAFCNGLSGATVTQLHEDELGCMVENGKLLGI